MLICSYFLAFSFSSLLTVIFNTIKELLSSVFTLFVCTCLRVNVIVEILEESRYFLFLCFAMPAGYCIAAVAAVALVSKKTGTGE